MQKLTPKLVTVCICAICLHVCVATDCEEGAQILHHQHLQGVLHRVSVHQLRRDRGEREGERTQS